jgi:phosphoenolpyruvate synthase/pyruvate phosphate dikinase
LAASQELFNARKKYYWNSVNNLGSGKKAVKSGDLLPDDYLTDLRLEGWVRNGIVSESKSLVSVKTELELKLEKLQADNLNLAAKIKVLTDRLSSKANLESKNDLLSSQNQKLAIKMAKLYKAMMDNEAQISDVIKSLESKSNFTKANAIEKLKGLLKNGGQNES